MSRHVDVPATAHTPMVSARATAAPSPAAGAASDAASGTHTTKPTDGRTTRWAQHNATRRGELVEAALRAIRAHGSAVGMDEIAAHAGTSKPVYYRHFGDRSGLYTAVVESVHRFILGNLEAPLASGSDPATLLTQLADSYLAVVEADQEIYRFVTQRPTGDSPDPVLGITNSIGDEVSKVFATWLERNGRDPSPANTWGHGAVGFVWAVADRWILTDMRRPRADIVDFVHLLFAPAFDAHSADAPPVDPTTPTAPRTPEVETKESTS